MALPLALVVALSAVSYLHADSQIATREAVEVMQALGSRVQNAHWKAEFTRGTLQSNKDSKAIVARTHKMSASVLFEPASQRARIESNLTMPWRDGPADTVSKVEGFAFDGKVFRRWSTQRPGIDLPDLTFSAIDGTITTDPTPMEAPVGASGFDHQLFLAGLRWFPPYFGTLRAIPALPLWRLLADNEKSGKEVTIIDKGNGLWEIETLDDEVRVRIHYDTQRGGVVTDAVWGSEKNVEDVWRRLDISLQEVDGFWVPKVAELIGTLDRPPTIERVEFHDVKLNQVLPDSAFLMDFPVRTRLVDYTSKKAYTVTGGPIADQEAVREFMRTSGLPDPDAGLQSGGLGLRLVGIIITAIIVAVLGYFVFRSRRAAILLLPVMMLACTSASGLDYEPGKGWILSHHSGEAIPISQCGFRAALFTLEYLGAGYDSEDVCRELQPTDDGISLEAIRRVMLAHGFQVDARKEVRIADLAALKPGIVAVFAIPATAGSLHFLCAIGTPTGYPVVVDAPFRRGSLKEMVTEEGLRATKGIVLFVSRDKSVSPHSLSARVTVMESTVELGDFRVREPSGAAAKGTVQGSFQVKNISDSPVMVKYAYSCGCMTNGALGSRIIAPGETCNEQFRVVPSAWGTGNRSKSIILRFPDKSEKIIAVNGRGLDSHESSELSFASPVITIVLPTHANPNKGGFRDVTFSYSNCSLKDIAFESTATWLSATAFEAEGRTGIARVVVTVDEQLRRQIAQDEMVDGELDARVSGSSSVAALRILLRPEPFFSIDPGRIKLARTSSTSSDLVVSSLDQSAGGLECLDMSVNREGLTISQKKLEGGSLCFVVKAQTDAKLGLYILKATIGAENRLPRRTVAIVEVTD
jgi:hypothetical protein